MGPVTIRHQVALSVDDNGLGQGEGWSLLGFYTAEVGYKNAFLKWNASSPVLGLGNTSRGFVQSFSAGYRHSFAW